MTREAATIQADHALRALEPAVTRIGRAMTVAEWPRRRRRRLAPRARRAATAHPELLREIAARSPQEPYRTYLLYTAARLEATRNRHADLAYAARPNSSPTCGWSRVAGGRRARRQAYGELQHLIWQAETFGFHLAGLEIRQHSAVHARALAEVRAGARRRAPVGGGPSEVLATLPGRPPGSSAGSALEACHRYVISFTTVGAGHRGRLRAGRSCALPDGNAPELDVVPLFESGEDLAHAPRVLTEMLELPPVLQRLAANGRHLEVMLGYSDSAKELGPASATLRLFDAQAASWPGGRRTTTCG